MEDCACPPVPVFYYDAFNTQARSCYMLIQILNIDVEIQEINFVQYESLGDNFRGMNTLCTVPTLIDGNITLCHGPTIMMYLCEKYSSPMIRSLFPQDYISRVKIMSLFFYEGYYLYRYLGHLLADVFLSKYPNIDLDFHYAKVSKAYNSLNNFLKGHCFMVSNCLTISDISAISSVGTLNMIFPIDKELHPSLFDWFQRLKKMEFYQLNDEGICKQRYLLELTGKLPFPIPFNNERRQSLRPSLDESVRKYHKVTDASGYDETKSSSDPSLATYDDTNEQENSERKPVSDASSLEIDLKKVRRKPNNGTNSECFHCTCISSMSPNSFAIQDAENARKSGNLESVNNFNKRRGSNMVDSCVDNYGAGRSTLQCRKSSVVEKPEDSLRRRTSSSKANNYKKASDNRENQAIMTRCCSNKSYRVCTCDNSKKNCNFMGKTKHKCKTDKRYNERNSNALVLDSANADAAPKSKLNNNTEKLKYCSCGGTEIPDQQYNCSCLSENPQHRQKLRENNVASTKAKYCDCAGTGILDQTYRCSCPSKSNREYEDDISQIEEQPISLENIPEPLINEKNVNIYNCECEQISSKNHMSNCSRQAQISCGCSRVDPVGNNGSPNSEEPNEFERSSIESETMQELEEETEDRADTATEEDTVPIENSEADNVDDKTTTNTILECDASTCPKLLNNIVSVNPEILNQNDRTEPPSNGNKRKNSRSTRDPKRSSRGSNRLQAGCNIQSTTKAKFQNYPVNDFEELKIINSYETLNNDSDERTEIIYHVNMRKCNLCRKNCSYCYRPDYQNNSVSKIPRLIANYPDCLKLSRNLQYSFSNRESFSKKYSQYE